MEELKKKAVAYVRISSTKQIDNESPETQKEKIQQYADANGIEIIKWFYDEAKSGKNVERQELQNLLKFALQYKKQIDYVIVYKMTRASRDLDSYINQVRLVLKARGISVRSATEPVDDTKMGRFMEGLFVLLGQLDNDGKAEYTIDNMRALAEQGYWQHPPVAGYYAHKIPNDRGKLRPSMKPNAKARLVTQVCERFSVGDITKAELTRYAKKIGLLSSYDTPYSEDSIDRLLRTPELAGYVHDKLTNYELVEGKHPAIISREIFERNQALLAAQKGGNRGIQHQKQNRSYVLKNLLLCSNCNKPMYASAPRTGSGGHSPRYHCSRTSCRGKVVSVKASLVKDDFVELLKTIKPASEILKLYNTILIREVNNSLTNLNKRIKSKRGELDRTSELRNNAISKYVAEQISLDEKNNLVDGLDERKLELSAELSELEQQQSLREADIEFAINFMESVDKQWENVEYDIKQRFQKMLFPEGLVYDSKKRGFGTKNISPLYRYIPNKKATKVALYSDLVALVHANWNAIRSELSRWRTLSGEANLLVSTTAQY